MSNATELLNGLTDEQIAAYTANPATEPHIVVNGDKTIVVPEVLRQINVQHEHNVETVTFDCPRYWDGLDLSTRTIYIAYTLSNGYDDLYPADNVTVDTDDETIMHFDWTISRNVTQVAGAVTIHICIKETDDEGNEILHWNSKKNNQMTISPCNDCTGKIADEHPDIINSLIERVDEAFPEVTSADNGKMMMVVDGVWTPVVFPGGTQYESLVVTIPVSSWTDNGSQITAVYSGLTKSVDGCHIHTSIAASSTPAQFMEATKCGVFRSGATGKQLVFTAASSMPTVDLVFDVLITKPTTLSYSLDQEGLVMTIVEE